MKLISQTLKLITTFTLLHFTTAADKLPGADLFCTNCEATKCIKSGSAYKCTQCDADYALKAANSNECILCQPHFYVDPDSKLCVECDKKQISKIDKCVSCKGDEYQKNNLCIKCPERNYSKDNVCTPCADGSIIKTGETVCTKCPDREVQVKNTCVKCTDTEIKVGNLCKKCEDKKIRKENTCVACKDGETFKDHACIKCEGRAYVKDNQCIKCKDNEKAITASDGKTVTKCEACPAHSIRTIKNEKEYCRACEETEYEKDNKCVALKPSEYQIDNKVYTCRGGTYADQKAKTCITCGKNCESCKQVNSNLECQSCIPGRFGVDLAKNSTCKQCEDTNCGTCASNYKKCEACMLGTSSNGGDGCRECKPNCMKCSTPNNCFECFPGLVLQGDNCYPEALSTSKDSQCSRNCLECSEYATCDKCFEGYFVNQNKLCQKCMNNCKKCARSDECEVCNMNYVKKYGACVSQDTFDDYWPYMLSAMGIAGLLGIGYLIYHVCLKGGGQKKSYVQMPETGNSYPYVSNPGFGGSQVPNRAEPMSPVRQGGELSQYIGF